MAMRKLKLLVFVTVCWVAPLAAQQAPFDNEPSGCPFAQAEAAAAQADSTAAVSDEAPFEGTLFDVGRHSAALAP